MATFKKIFYQTNNKLSCNNLSYYRIGKRLQESLLNEMSLMHYYTYQDKYHKSLNSLQTHFIHKN